MSVSGLEAGFELPVAELRGDLLRALAGPGARVILRAPTGSGKSTLVPQLILDGGCAGSGQVVILQPRRLAAILLARTVARLRGGAVGGEVGYQVRFENRNSTDTRIRYVTEGILLRELLQNPHLRGISVVVLDEFHERHLSGDVALARLRMLQEASRPDLKLVIMSATLDTGALETYLTPCEVLESAGRVHPVEIRYCPRGSAERSLPEQSVSVLRLALDERRGETGNVLVFLPGAHAIRTAVNLLRGQAWCADRNVLPLYGELSREAQDAAVAEGKESRIIVSTNIAETSLTLPGIRLVIDSGVARVPRYDAARGLDTLLLEKISRASAEQRAGRAGRTAPGSCYRMWSEEDQAHRPAFTAPEIHRVDLAETVLTLAAGGLDPRSFPWFDAPRRESLEQALDLLSRLGAIDAQGGLTDTGRSLVRFPVHPRFARMILEGERRGLVHTACLAAALCEGPSLWSGPRGGPVPDRFLEKGDESDLLPLLRAWRYARACRFDHQRCMEAGVRPAAVREADRLAGLFLRSAGSASAPEEPGEDAGPLREVMLSGFSDHLAARSRVGSRAFKLSNGVQARLDRGSVVTSRSNLVVACNLAEIQGREVEVILGLATALDEQCLENVFPGEFRESPIAVWDPGAKRVVRRMVKSFRDLVLEQRETGEPNLEEAALLLAQQIAGGELKLAGWDARVEGWLRRVELLGKAMPELGLPAFGEEDRLLILTEVCRGALTYRQVKDRPVWPVLRHWLSDAQRELLDGSLPERVTLENGVSANVNYLHDPPTISVMLQKLYGLRQLPALADGRIRLRLQILAPNQRPVQTISNLDEFWENSYPEIRKQLRGRYPKHEWR
ncbi:MAG TPA: ATP-dependent helicase HrpB [Verrucomicrobiales bacterium]|nr:ATP-dependent helicase HrpB [Verrucomicrobiales bacterium]